MKKKKKQREREREIIFCVWENYVQNEKKNFKIIVRVGE